MMMYPLVRELAADGIPVTVSCRVLDLSRAPFYRWLEAPFTDGQLDVAYLANATFDAHTDIPSSGVDPSLTRSAASTPTCPIGSCGGSAGTTAGGRCLANPNAPRDRSLAHRHTTTSCEPSWIRRHTSASRATATLDFKSSVQYRWPTLLGMLALLTEPAVYLAVWSAVADQGGGTVGGLTAGQISAYYVVWTLVRNLTAATIPARLKASARLP